MTCRLALPAIAATVAVAIAPPPASAATARQEARAHTVRVCHQSDRYLWMCLPDTVRVGRQLVHGPRPAVRRYNATFLRRNGVRERRWRLCVTVGRGGVSSHTAGRCV